MAYRGRSSGAGQNTTIIEDGPPRDEDKTTAVIERN
jgi:hypothetical protein